MKLRLALLPFLAIPAQAQEAPELPSALFGVELGATYEYAPSGADTNSAGSFPVRRLASEAPSLHRGISLYFEPLIEEPDFPFHEIARENGTDPLTTHRVFVFPIIPELARTLDELQDRHVPQQVFMIEWSRGDGQTSDRDDYTWAFDLCRAFEADFGIAPEITDRLASNSYRCVFSAGERELEVTSVLGRTIQLSFTDDIESRTEAEVISRMWRLERGLPVRPARAATVVQPR